MIISEKLGSGQTEGFTVKGECTIGVCNLTAGNVQLQYLLPLTAELTSTDWLNYPESAWDSDVFKTIDIQANNIQFRLVGTSVNSDAYYFLSRRA